MTKPKRTTRYGFCVYCGIQVQTQQPAPAPITCQNCRNLPQRDPHYAQPPDQWSAAR